jgi:hypothetical protein
MPKQKCMTVYTAVELKTLEEDADHDGRPFTRALEKYRENLTLDYVSEEMMNSLKGLCAAAGIRIRDYSLGAYNRGNNLRVEIPGEDGAADLTGARALAWIENRILGPLRAPWGLRSPAASTKKYVNGSHSTVYNLEDGRPRRRWTAPGVVPSCPFTGVCYDEDFLDDVVKSVRDGRTLKEAFEDLADVFARMLEDEYEYQGKEEQFLEAAEVNEWEFDEEGDMV